MRTTKRPRGGHSALGLLIAGALVAAGMLGATPARGADVLAFFADPPFGMAGAITTLRGSGFPSGVELTLTFSQNGTTQTIGTATVGGAGAFDAPVTIPGAAGLGEAWLGAAGELIGTATTPFDVTANDGFRQNGGQVVNAGEKVDSCEIALILVKLANRMTAPNNATEDDFIVHTTSSLQFQRYDLVEGAKRGEETRVSTIMGPRLVPKQQFPLRAAWVHPVVDRTEGAIRDPAFRRVARGDGGRLYADLPCPSTTPFEWTGDQAVEMRSIRFDDLHGFVDLFYKMIVRAR